MVLSLLGSGTAFGQGPPYTFTKIAYPGAVLTEPTGVNNAGKVVGTYFSADGTRHGFVYDAGTYTTIDFPGAPYTYLFGINAAGQMVGSYSLETPMGHWHGLLVDGATFTTFDFPTQMTDGRAINASGHIVGVYDVEPGQTDHGFTKIGDAYTSIDVVGSLSTYAFGVNDAGTTSGSYVDAGGLLHGWIRNGTAFTFVNFPGATQTVIGGINNAGTVVGWSDQPTKRNGFIFTGTSYRAFDADFPGTSATAPLALNDVGQIVGTYNSPECLRGCGFLATPAVGTAAICEQSVSASYSAGTLTLGYTLKTSTPLVWDVYLYALGTVLPAWSFALPAISPAVNFNVPISGVPPVGPLANISLLRTGGGDAVCIDFVVTNAVSGGATASRD